MLRHARTTQALPRSARSPPSAPLLCFAVGWLQMREQNKGIGVNNLHYLTGAGLA